MITNPAGAGIANGSVTEWVATTMGLENVLDPGTDIGLDVLAQHRAGAH